MESNKKESRTKNLRKKTFNIQKANHAQKLMEIIISSNSKKYQINIEPYQQFPKSDMVYLWHNTPSEEIYKHLSDKGKLVNKYPNVKTLARKDVMQEMLEVSGSDWVPPNFNIPKDLQKLKDYKIANPNAIFISKPAVGSLGDQITLVNDLKDVPDECVVQRYIHQPYLLDGLKFDLRVYVVISGTDHENIKAHICKEGLARFCTEPYENPTKSNFKKVFMHLTNYSLNKTSDKFVDETEVENIHEPNNGSKRTLTALFKQIGDADIISEIQTNIKQAIESIMPIFINMMRLYSNPQNKRFPGKVYQIYGFDILIDKHLKAWLLEINDHPSLDVYACKESMGCAHKNCPISQVDVYVKSTLLTDIFNLMYKKQARSLIQLQIPDVTNLTNIFTLFQKIGVTIVDDEMSHKEKGPVVLKMANLTKFVSKWLSITRINAQAVLLKLGPGIHNNEYTGFFQFVHLLKVLNSLYAENYDFDSFILDLLKI